MTGPLIEQYEIGGQTLGQAIAGLSDAQLRSVPIPGKWSTHQVVIHLADADAAFADRIRRIIAMDNPALLAWDESAFAKNLHYEQQSAEDAVAMIDLTRRQMARILKSLPDEMKTKTGMHSERGKQTLEEVIGFANWHLDHHLKFVAEKRAKLTTNNEQANAK
jgi:uncharacterized damage-inducible protein DinB